MHPEIEMFGSGRITSAPGVEEARHELSRLFLPVEFPSARASSTVGLTLNAVIVGRTTCGYMRFREPVRIDTAEADNYHVDIPMTGRATMEAGLGTPVYGTSRTAGVFMPGRPVSFDCSPRFSQLSLMFPRDDVRRELEDLLGEPAVRPLEFAADLSMSSAGGQAMLLALRMIDRTAAQANGALAHPLAVQRLEQALLHSLLFGQPHNYTAALAAPSPTAGTRPVSRAAELLRSDPGRPWTVAELAAEVSMSVRSLQEGFRRSLGTTPMRYLRRLRLEKVQHELSEATPGTVTVTDVATRWGFLHLGRFAAAYAHAFGEQPSVTLRR
ncbi:helix-turn-helix domain-containing protein [Leifsonia shinshuensis]|uniref:AraC-like DNA-binding protein n=1 Tax=Leifsonia shinshuensis TaxID=150026 RepID=A0A853CR01_9MICO|nr:AraC-like DNA-binding protein [Leifsonia shinshuensis]